MDVNDILFPYFGDNNSKETKNLNILHFKFLWKILMALLILKGSLKINIWVNLISVISM